MKYINDAYYLDQEEIDRLFPDDPTPITFNLSPGEKIERAFSLLESKMKEALSKRLDPAVYVMSADYGTGKNQILQKVLRSWKADGFPGDGAIIFVSTLAEIDANVIGSGLDKPDYAVLTSDPKYAAYGAGRYAAQKVPVLFVTQTMARKQMLLEGSFEAVADFRLNGKVRSLRVWDESFMAAEGVAFDRVDLCALPSAYKTLPKADREVLNALLNTSAAPEPGLMLDIPLSIIDTGDEVLKRNMKVGETPTRTLEALTKLGGSKAFLGGNEDAGWSFLGAGRPLPRDIAPLFVLDASARLTSRYSKLPAYGFKVVNLEPARLEYDKVAFHWWNRGAGKTALRNATERNVIFKGIAELVNAKAEEAFLIVIAKDACAKVDNERATLPPELHAMIANPDRVRVVTWGRHIGTNEFRDIPNVIVVSAYNYGNEGYDALALAASGKPGGGGGCKSERDKQEAEAFMHNLYQAVCRSKVRIRDGASSGAANVYLIMKDSERRRAQVRQAFPGCSIEAWTPCAPTREKKHDLVLRVLSDLMATRSSVSLRELTEACGGTGASYLTKVLKTPIFKDALRKMAVERQVNMLTLRKPFASAT